MQTVTYTGPSDVRVVSAADLARLGIVDQPTDLIFNKANAYTMNVPDDVALVLFTQFGFVGGTGQTLESFFTNMQQVAELAATKTIYVSTGSSANDSNDGRTAYTAKATGASAVTALAGTAGVIQYLYGTFVMTGVVLAAGQTIKGLGEASTILKINVDAGTGHYGIDCSASQMATPITVENLQLFGPGNGAFVIGTAPANMSGIKTGSKAKFRNLYVQGFYAGIEITSDHEHFDTCKSSNNWYNVYETAALGARGNEVFTSCDFTGATRASVACSKDGSFDGSTWLQSHVGFAPYGFYKEAQLGVNTNILTNSWCDIAFEECGNACIIDPAPTGSTVTISNTTFFDAVFGTESAAGPYHDASLASDAAVAGGLMSFNCISDRTTTSGGATYVFKASAVGSRSIVKTDRAPLANDFNGNWVGSEFRANNNNGPFLRATVCTAMATITQGQVLQMQAQAASVRAFASDTSHSYVGVAAFGVTFNAVPGNPVTVYTEGLVSVLCSEHITAANCRLEIDPAAPSQVRAVNMDTGTAFAATTQVPSAYPVLGIANAGNSAINTLIGIWLYPAPYTDPGYVNPAPVSALPTAGASNVGQMLMVPGNHTTTADKLYVCLESATATYSWVQIATG